LITTAGKICAKLSFNTMIYVDNKYVNTFLVPNIFTIQIS